MQNYLDHKLEEAGLFQTRFEDGGYVIWRPLPWAEYRKYRDARNILGPKIDVEIENSVYSRCVLHSTYDVLPSPELSEEAAARWLADCRADQPAGVVPTVVKSVMFMSGAQTGPAIMGQLSQHRPLVSNVEDQLVALVCKAFPAYTPEAVEALSWHMLLKRVAQAEMLLGDEVSLMESASGSANAAEAERLRIQREIRQASMGGAQSNEQRVIDPHNPSEEDIKVMAQRRAAAQRAAKLKTMYDSGQINSLRKRKAAQQE